MRNPYCQRLLMSAVIGSMLVACNSGGNDNDPPPPPPPPIELTPTQKITALEANGQLPKLDRSASLAGPDVNQNGVRDDIDAEIQAKITDPSQRRSAVQMAKALQGAVTVDVSNIGAVKTVSQQMLNATSCLFVRFPATEGPLAAPALSSNLEAMTANTKLRLRAYLAFNKALDGTAASLPKGDTCE